MGKSWTAFCLVSLSMASSYATLKVVDLTHELGNETVYWPGSPPFSFDILTRGNQSEGYWNEVNYFSTPEHGGTHVDAPAHFAENQLRVEQIPASSLVGPAVVVDVQAKASVNPDYQLSKPDVVDWEAKYGRIPERAIVIMNSGWSSRYPNAARVFNTDTLTDPSTFRFPSIHPEAAVFLITQRRVAAIGVDTPSVDFGASEKFETHRAMGTSGVFGIENVANVGELPPRGATVVVGVVKLRQGSGGPARVLGLVGSSLENCETWGWLGTSGQGGLGSAVHLGGTFWIVAVVVVLIAGVLVRRFIKNQRHKQQ